MWTSQISPDFFKSVTSVSNLNSTPFTFAFSANAIFRLNGHTIPALGAYNAAQISSSRFGSISCTSSLDKIRSPGISSSSLQTTREPIRLNGKSRSLESCSIKAFPRTFNFAIREPSFASYPACTIALFALDVPQQTSSSFSITHTFAL